MAISVYGLVMKTQLKLSTLVGIAKSIEKENGISRKCTMKEMWDDLSRVAGHCRTKEDARMIISEIIYNQ
jgi:hypothetical protein